MMAYKHNVIFRDGTWELSQDMKMTILRYWVSHRCNGGGVTVYRFNDNVSQACAKCKSVCPPGLQGMLMTLAWL